MSASVGRWSVLLLLLLASLSPLIQVSEAVGGTISQDEIWSGAVVLDSDVSVNSGVTLTISAGTDVKVPDDYTIRVTGNIVIEGTSVSPVTIWSNRTATGGTSISGVWGGINVLAGGSVTASHVSVSRARGAFDVYGSGTLDDVTVYDSFVGMRLWGSATITDFACERIDFTCLEVRGSASADGVSTRDAGLGVDHIGSLDLTDLTVTDSGLGIQYADGSSGSTQVVNLTNLQTGLVVRGATSVSASQVMGSNLGLLMDAVSTSGFTLSDANVTDIEVLVLGTDVLDLTLSAITVSSASSGSSTTSPWAVDVRNEGSFRLQDSNLSGFSGGIRLTGSGSHFLDGVDLDLSGMFIDASGTGSLLVEDGTWVTSGDGFGHLSSLTTEWSQLSMSGGSAVESGLEITGGQHSFTTVEVGRQYQSTDQQSVGVDVLWADITANGLTLSGWNTGVDCGQDCSITGDSLTAGQGGVNGGSGMLVDGGEVTLVGLATLDSDVGVQLADGNLHVETWGASNHGSTTLQVDDEGSAIIRFFPAGSSLGLFDAMGGGSLLWGSSGTASIAVSISEEFTESTVEVTDLTTNPQSGVQVLAHGFSEVSDSMGEVSLPLLQSGSTVVAHDAASGAGASAVLTPPGGTLQLPLLPSSGDWTVPAGVDAILSNGAYSLPGNLTIETTASLSLLNASLSLSGIGMFTVQGTGQLFGDAGSLSGGTATLNSAVPLGGSGLGLTVSTPVSYTCSSPRMWHGVYFTAGLSISADCGVTLENGGATGTIIVGEGGWLELRSALTVRVLDWGLPVQGASVATEGSTQATDSAGEATFSVTARNVTSEGENVRGIVTVSIFHGAHNQLRSWDTSSSTSFDVMMSTVTGGMTTGWLRLEKAFSPYYLDNNLTITRDTTMSLLAQVSLTVASDRGITVKGVLESDRAAITGTDWNGISTAGGEALVTLEQGTLAGAPLVAGPDAAVVTISGMMLDGAVLQANSVGEPVSVSVTDSLLHQYDGCVQTNGVAVSLTLYQVTLQDCGQFAAMFTTSNIELSDSVLGAGNDVGLWLRGVSGNVSGIDGSGHDGSGSVILAEMLGPSVSLTGLNLNSSGSSPAVLAQNCDQLLLSDSVINGAPGIHLDASAASLSGLSLFGDGTGEAIIVQGVRAQTRTVIADSDVSAYHIGLLLSGDTGDLEAAGPLLLSNNWGATKSIESSGLSFESRGDALPGVVQLGGNHEYSAEVWYPTQFDHDSTVVSGAARLLVGDIWELTVLGSAGEPLDGAHVQVTVPSFKQEQQVDVITVSGNASVELLFEEHNIDEISQASEAMYQANFPDHIEADSSFAIGRDTPRQVTIQLTMNQPPSVTITEPSGDVELQQGDTLDLEASAQDPDAGQSNQLTYSWYLREQGENSPGQLQFEGLDGWYPVFSDVGVYIVTIEARDPWGAMASASVTVTVLIQDNDLDFIDSCQISGPNQWYDLEEERFCGPDVFDEDDDNDFIKDIRDDFPFDRCASTDTDFDGLPDSLLPGCETDLIEDDDDDNDGVVDTEDADPLDATISTPDTDSGSSGLMLLLSPQVVLPTLLLVGTVVFIFMRRRKDDDVEGPGTF